MQQVPVNSNKAHPLALWLRQHDVSLAFSTYRANRLIFVGRDDADRLKLHERLFDRPMGLYVHQQVHNGATVHSLWMAGRSQVWRFDNLLSPGQRHEGGDRLYVPAACFTTGEVNAHEIVMTPDAHGVDQPLFVNTAFSCLAGLQPGASFAPTWQPPFITKLTPDDRCHMNGLALLDGVPTWATACGTRDTPAGWREHREGGGVLLHLPTNSIAATGLSMPHSPRWHAGKLWLLNSGTGQLGWIDNGRFEPLCFLPGFARGLAFVGGGAAGGFAVVGLSKLRSSHLSGLPLDQELLAAGLPGGCCGLRVIDLATGVVVHSLDLPEPIDELFDVVTLPGVQQPRALGLQGEDIHCLVKLPGQSQLTTVRPKAPSGNPHQAAAPLLFGLPTAQQDQADSPAPAPVSPTAVRYQQVFQLTPQTLAPYAGMTFPSLAPGSKRLTAITGELLAVSAMASGTMVAMAVAERHPDGSASLCSLLVQAPLRRQGIGTRLVAHLQQFLALEGAHRLSVRFTGNAVTSASLEPLLARLGWSAPVTNFVLLQGSADKLATVPWHQRFALPASYTLFAWPHASAADRATAHTLGAAPELLPPVSDAGIEPAVSLGLRHQGQLVGWLIAHRMDATTVRYSSLYVAPGHRSRGQGPALIAEGLQRQQRAGIARAKTAVDVRNPSFLRFCQKHLHPYIDAVSTSRQASVVLPTATP